MLPLVDLAVALGGLIIPPAFNFIKKKFIKSENDTPERTIGDLATTKPEVLPEYVSSLVQLKKVAIDFFNRDVIGVPSQWVVNLRAAIRPLGVIAAFGLLSWLAYLTITGEMIDYSAPATDTLTGIRISCEAMISSWFGHRIAISK